MRVLAQIAVVSINPLIEHPCSIQILHSAVTDQSNRSLQSMCVGGSDSLSVNMVEMERWLCFLLAGLKCVFMNRSD